MRYNIKLLEKELQTVFIKPVVLRTVDSTNDYARKIIEKEQNCELVVISEEQTKGKGRFSRDWFSPEGKGIWMSVVKNNIFAVQYFGIISLLTSLSVFDALYELYDLKVELKWPNDILYKGRKLCGILIESFKRGRKITDFIIGIGINILQEEDDFPGELRKKAVSVLQIIPEKIKREKLIVGIINEINRYFDLLNDGKIESIILRWKENSRIFGKNIILQKGNTRISGKATDINLKGNLILKTKEEKIIEIDSGQIILIQDN